MARIDFVHYFDLPLDEYLRMLFDPSEDEKNDLTELPNVQEREEVERCENDRTIRTVVRYFATGFIPPAARKYLKPDMLSWLEYSTWDKGGLFWDWKIEPHFFREYVECSGRMSLHADGARTKRITRGALKIKLPLIGELGEKLILEHLKKNIDLEHKMFQEMLKRTREKREAGEDGCRVSGSGSRGKNERKR